MISAPWFDELDKLLNEDQFNNKDGVVEGLPQGLTTVGFLLFSQNFKSSSVSDVISNLDMLNSHSGSHIHFYLCGVSKFGTNTSENVDGKELGEIDGARLFHNAHAALSFAQGFEKEIPGFRFDLGFDLLLIDLDLVENRRVLSCRSAVYFKMDELIKADIVRTPSEFLGKLINFAKEERLTSAAAFRDELARKYGINWIKGLILAMFPAALGKFARTQAVLGGGTALGD